MPTPLPWRSSVARHDAWKAWEQDNTVTSRALMGARQMEQGSAGALGLGVAGAFLFAAFLEAGECEAASNKEVIDYTEFNYYR